MMYQSCIMLSQMSCWPPGGELGGHLHWKVVRGYATVMTPFLSGQSVFRRLPVYHQCTAHVPSFSIFRKKLHFQPCLAIISALKTKIFQIFVPIFCKTPHFSRKLHFLDPTFGNLCSTHTPSPGYHVTHVGFDTL